MEGGRDPFNRRPYPWGHEDPEFLSHFRRLGQLRRQNPELRLGDIHFFLAEDRHVGFTRSYQGSTLRVYCNRSSDAWEIPSGRIVMGYNVQIVSHDCLTLGPRGFCITKE